MDKGGDRNQEDLEIDQSQDKPAASVKRQHTDLLKVRDEANKSIDQSLRIGQMSDAGINKTQYTQSSRALSHRDSIDGYSDMQSMMQKSLGKNLGQSELEDNTKNKEASDSDDGAELLGSRVIQVLADNKEKRRICCKYCCFKSVQEMYKTNKIMTGKYNLLTFLPLNLQHQFSKMANLYFLLMMALETYKPISDSGGKPVLALPLSFVIGLSLVKDGYEDIKRHLSDRRENLKTVTAVVSKISQFGPIERLFQTVKWKEIKVGQIVKVEENEYFPCDLILLNSDLPNGVCYVETKNLDGETNLKHKKANEKTVELCKSNEDAINNFTDTVIECEKENEFIYKFNGQLRMRNDEVIGLGEEQILLRGSSLRNTGYVWGIAVYTGHDSKVMMNSARGVQKKSKLDIAMNRYILMAMGIQLLMCITATVFSAVWMLYNFRDPVNNPFYLELDRSYRLNSANVVLSDQQNEISLNWRFVRRQMILGLGKWMLALVNFVSISLLTTLEIVKFWQAVFIEWDVMMYDEEQDQLAKAQSSSLNEELGQVSYIFSDKTGTLTKNIMEFKSFTAGYEAYGSKDDLVVGQEEAERQQKALDEGITNVNFVDERFWEQWQNSDAKNQDYLEKAVNILAVCHTIVPNHTDEGVLTYNASSPDELALTNAARFFGYVFEDRDSANKVTIHNKHTGEKRYYELLNVIEFTSLRKRMSVIVRTQDDKILCMTKGADSIIFPLLHAGQDDLIEKTEELLQEYANQGLRTLLLAQREIDPSFYDQWSKKYENALAQLSDREKHVNMVADQIECEFELVGSTAIEDKLQDNVSDVIKDIRLAGIKFWVLTGDKIETAINIGFSCNVLDDQMEIFIINEAKQSGIAKQLETFMEQQRKIGASRDCAIVIGGDQLMKITTCPKPEKKAKMLAEFLQLTENASVVIACRVSPKQKAEVVKLVREKKKQEKKAVTTLAIGDGANDVNMITAAHLGVGISGLEGQQASRSADYSICQFQFLKNLLFCHGREAYRRNSYLINYTFYKNVLLVLPIYYFGVFSAFTGVNMYDVLLNQLYNVLMTGIPVCWFALYDWEFKKPELLANPKHYKIGLKNECFSPGVFWRWWFYAFWQSLFILLFTLFYLDRTTPYIDIGDIITGNFGARHNIVQGSVWIWGTFMMQVIILLVSVKLLVSANEHTFWSMLFIIICVISFYIYLLIFNFFPLSISQLLGVGSALIPFLGNYLLIFPIVFAFTIIDICLWHFNKQIKLAYEALEEEKELHDQIEKQSMIDSRVNKMSTYQHTGFAFDGAAGHDVLVTDNLKNRFRYAVGKQFNSNLVPFAVHMWSDDSRSRSSSMASKKSKNQQITKRHTHTEDPTDKNDDDENEIDPKVKKITKSKTDTSQLD